MANNPANYDYHTTGNTAPASPYGSGDPYYNKSSGYIASGPPKQQRNNWVRIGIPILILVIVGAVVGGVVGSRASKKNNGGSSGGSNSDGGNGDGSNPVINGLARLPSSTDPVYGMPIYPSSVSPSCPSNPGMLRCLTFLFRLLCHLSLGDRTLVPPLSTTRPTLPSMANRRSPQMPSYLGLATTSTPAPRRLPACAQIDLELSLPPTSGMPLNLSSIKSRTSAPGMRPFSRTPPIITPNLLSSTTWMVTVVSLTTPEKSR
jgi:hypothetical protein